MSSSGTRSKPRALHCGGCGALAGEQSDAEFSEKVAHGAAEDEGCMREAGAGLGSNDCCSITPLQSVNAVFDDKGSGNAARRSQTTQMNQRWGGGAGAPSSNISRIHDCRRRRGDEEEVADGATGDV